jgi:DNA-binding PadR family transcriptional regulator
MTLLGALVQSPEVWRYGYDLSKQTGLKAGTLYPLLMRLERLGWLETTWGELAGGRPPRHLHRLTALGLTEARGRLTAERARVKGSLVLQPDEGG